MKTELSLLLAACLLVLLYIPTKYYQSMSMGCKVMERKRTRLQYFCFRGDNFITNIVRVVSCTGHAYWSSSSSLPNIIKLFQCGSYGLHKILASMEITIHNKDIERCFSCMQRACWSSSTFLPNIIKICPRVPKLWSKQGCVYGRTPC